MEKDSTPTALSMGGPADPFIVTFNIPHDPENPKDWSRLKKWTVTTVLAASTFNRIMVSTIMAPSLSTIASELEISYISSVMSMSIFTLAGAFGPLFIGPLSELYGRSVILHATNVWFLIFNLLCGFAKNEATLISARLLAGLGASAVYALVGGVLGDIWRPEERGRGLSLYYLFPLLGVAAGPLIGGYITEYTTWRYEFWTTSAFQGVLIVLCFVFFEETCPEIILERKAKKLRRRHGSAQYRTIIEQTHAHRSPLWILARSLTRPMRLLIQHPIVQIQALFSGFEYGLLYIVLTSYSDLWVSQYHESVARSGLHYITICIAEVIGAQVSGVLLDVVFAKLKARAGGVAKPEFRMPIMLPGAVLVPIGLFIYGWTAQFHQPWIAVDVGAFILTFGMQVNGGALQAYIIDSYPEHASSATAAAQFVRSLAAFGFPLFVPAMQQALGYGWAYSMLGFVSIVIGIGAPILVWKYGEALRERTRNSY